MEEVVLTDDEKELLELLKWAIDLLSNYPFATDEQKKALQETKELYMLNETTIMTLAKGRTTFYKELAEAKFEYMNLYLDVTCPKCKYLTALKPVGEKVGGNGFRYAVYECPKCSTKFSTNIPITIEDKVVVTDIMLKLMRKKKVNPTVIKNLELSMENLKKATKEVDERTADLQKLYDDHAVTVADDIVKMIVYKQRYLSGGKESGIN